MRARVCAVGLGGLADRLTDRLESIISPQIPLYETNRRASIGRIGSFLKLNLTNFKPQRDLVTAATLTWVGSWVVSRPNHVSRGSEKGRRSSSLDLKTSVQSVEWSSRVPMLSGLSAVNATGGCNNQKMTPKRMRPVLSPIERITPARTFSLFDQLQPTQQQKPGKYCHALLIRWRKGTFLSPATTHSYST